MAKKSLSARILAFAVCLLVVYFIAFLGSVFTSKNVNSAWYESIRPSITPPNWVFPVVWNILFFLIALSLYYAWSAKKERLKIAIVFSINFIFNVLWSYLYFGIQSPSLAFYDIILVWLSIGLMIVTLWKISRISSYLLIPYFLWVSFASVLNYLSI